MDPSSIRLHHTASTPADSAAFVAVMASTFTVSLGYGVVLPIVPFIMDRLMPVTERGIASWHTGALAGIYMLFIFLFAPLWGRVSDRIGRRPVILLGLIGYAATLVLFAFSNSMSFAYGARALAGAFVSAVAPVASAFVSETTSEAKRARRLAWLGASSLAGFLTGPAMSGGFAQLGKVLDATGAWYGGAIALPLFATATLGLIVAIAIYLRLPRSAPPALLAKHSAQRNVAATRHSLGIVLALNLLVTFGLGSFEVGITLQMSQSAGFEPSRLATMFAECSLVMIAVQILVFSPAVKALSGRRLIIPAFLAMALGLALIPGGTSFYMMIVSVGLIAASAGLIMPALTHMVSLQTVLPLGVALGAQTSLSSIGQGLGSAAAGALYGVLAERLFWVSAVFMALGAGLSFAMP